MAEAFDDIAAFLSRTVADAPAQASLRQTLLLPDTLIINQLPHGAAAARTCLDEADLLWIATEPAGCGLGYRLMEALTQALRSAGVKRLWLEVRAGNQAALRLYRKCGAVECGRRPLYYSSPSEDALLMRLNIII